MGSKHDFPTEWEGIEEASGEPGKRIHGGTFDYEPFVDLRTRNFVVRTCLGLFGIALIVVLIVGVFTMNAWLVSAALSSAVWLAVAAMSWLTKVSRRVQRKARWYE